MNDSYEDRIRRTVQHAAASTSVPVGLAERLLAGARSDESVRPLHTDRARTTGRRVRGWWPLLGAAAVLALAVALTWVSVHRGRNQPAHPTPTPSSVPVSPIRGPVPAGFRGVDLSFADASHGWALGTTQCTSVAGNQCATVIRTSDGGHTWGLVASPPAAVNSAPICRTSSANPPACVGHVAFVDDHVGYLWSDSSVYLTVDGGGTWSAQPGGALRLVIARGVVVRQMREPCGECGTVHYQVAPVGSNAWRELAVPNRTDIESELFAGRDAFYLVESPFSNAVLNLTTGQIVSRKASGSVDQLTLYRSTDAARTWERMTTVPLPYIVNGLSAALDDSLLFVRYDAPQSPIGMSTSTDGGRTFGPYRDFPRPNLALPTVRAISADRTLAIFPAVSGVGNHNTTALSYLSTDAGRTWHLVQRENGVDSVTEVGMGFSSVTNGFRLAADQRSAWLTTDGGQTWIRHAF
jgi:hypothetical protein